MFVCLFDHKVLISMVLQSLLTDSSEKSPQLNALKTNGDIWEAYCLAFALLVKPVFSVKHLYLFHLCLSLCLTIFEFLFPGELSAFVSFFFPSHWFDIIQITWFYSSFHCSSLLSSFIFSLYISLCFVYQNSSNSWK